MGLWGDPSRLSARTAHCVTLPTNHKIKPTVYSAVAARHPGEETG